MMHNMLSEIKKGGISLFFASETFDAIMDKVIRAIIIFLTIVGIPYTAFLLVWHFLSL